MTTATAAEVEGRKRGRPRRAPNMATALGGAFVAAALALGSGLATHTWPSDLYRDRPIEFAREIVGAEPWDKQVEILEAVRDHKRVAVTSGHKVSKSHSAGLIALWFYSSFDDARVVMSSTTSRQVDKILWREIRMMHARAGRCVGCKAADKARLARREPAGPLPCPHSQLIDGDLGVLARTGLRTTSDFREIVGFTAREAEAVAGVSGKNLLYILDEASGIPDEIFAAIEGNRAGGARVVMFSNPTKTEGEFFEAFHAKAELYKLIQISSEETPNVRAGREIIPGLATLEWVEEKRKEWGPDSPLYKVRVKGEFVLKEDGKIISIHAISEAEARWLEDVPAEGRLCIGIDPAGANDGDASDRDETVFAPRRGQKILNLLAVRGLDEHAILVNLLGMLKDCRRARDERPLVVLDSEGDIGSRVARCFRDHLADNPDDFDLICVKASNAATRQPQNYDRTRDELWANFADWLREGGAIPGDAKLAKELHAPEWFFVETKKGKLAKVTPKKDLRKFLGRSPDRADASLLAVWSDREPDVLMPPPAAPLRTAAGPSPDPEFASLDPYAGAAAWGRSR